MPADPSNISNDDGILCLHDMFAEARTSREVEKGAVIFGPEAEPQSVFFLETGACRVFQSVSDGREWTIAFVSAGALIGEGAILSGCPRVTSAVAVRQSKVSSMKRGAFLQSLRDNRAVAVTVARVLSGRLLTMQNRAEDFVFREAPARFARTLLELSEGFGVEGERGVRIDLKLVQREIGMFIGVSRPTANLIIQSFREQGVIRYDRGILEIIDLDAIRSLGEL